MSLFSPMKSIDTFLFSKCDEFKKNSTYQKLTDFNATIEQDSRDLFNFLLSALFFLIPLAITLALFLRNSSIKSDIAQREQVAQEAEKFLAIKNKTLGILRPVLSNPKVNNQNDFLTQIKSVAGQLPSNKVGISNFDLIEIGEGLSKVQATITFEGAYNRNLAQFIENLVNRKKILFVGSKITKNPDTDLLSGNIQIVHFSK